MGYKNWMNDMNMSNLIDVWISYALLLLCLHQFAVLEWMVFFTQSSKVNLLAYVTNLTFLLKVPCIFLCLNCCLLYLISNKMHQWRKSKLCFQFQQIQEYFTCRYDAVLMWNQILMAWKIIYGKSIKIDPSYWCECVTINMLQLLTFLCLCMCA